jgi:hypothetical protein
MTMTSSKRTAAAFWLMMASAAPAALPMGAFAQQRPPSAQELETARTLYKEGKELRAKGDIRGALEKLQAAHALGNTPVTGVELAHTYVLVEMFVEARETCLYIGRMPVAPDETEKSAEARTEARRLADELRPRIPTLVVKVTGLSSRETARVSIDGTVVPEAAAAEAQKVNPGRHEVVVQVGEGRSQREARATAEVIEGESREVTLAVAPFPPVAVPESPPSPEALSRTHSAATLANVGIAVAIVGAVAGLVTGFVAMKTTDQLASECSPQKRCPPGAAADDLQTAKTLATASNISFAVAGVGALIGIVFLATGRSDSPSKAETASAPSSIGFSAAGLYGRF